jgi:hypothetical protein
MSMGSVWGGQQQGEGTGKDTEGEKGSNTLHNEDSLMNHPHPARKLFERGGGVDWEYNGGGEVVQGALYSCMELSQ